MNTATTIEQSKRLMELGIDPNTADMHYGVKDKNNHELQLMLCPYTEEVNILSKMLEYKGFDIKEYAEKAIAEIIPAWSLSSLLELISCINDDILISVETSYYKDVNTWRVSTTLIDDGIETFERSSNNLFSSIIDLIEQLVKQGYIKTKNQEA